MLLILDLLIEGSFSFNLYISSLFLSTKSELFLVIKFINFVCIVLSIEDQLYFGLLRGRH